MATDELPISANQSAEFGPMLRHWRRLRGLSQQGLAERSRMSTRHLSFLETGRCGPSRSAVLQLCRALDVPDSEVERLLLVAGYAGDWTRQFADPVALRPQLEKVSHLLAAHDPLPAVITDSEWQVSWSNRGALAFFRRLQELCPKLCIEPLDLRALLADAQSLGRVVANWNDLLQAVVAGLYQLEPDPASFGQTRTLLDVLPPLDLPGAAVARAARTTVWQQALRIRDAGVEFGLELFSLPFAGAASGFALVLAHEADAASAPIAREYFSKLAAQS